MQDALEVVHLQGVFVRRGSLAAGQQAAEAVELEDGEHEGELEEGAKDGGRDAADRPAHDAPAPDSGSAAPSVFLLARSSIQTKHFSSPGIPPSPP